MLTTLYFLIQGWIKCLESLTIPHQDQPFLTYLHTHLLTSYYGTRLKSRNCEWNHGKQNKKTEEYRISNVFCLSDEIKDATKSQKMSKKQCKNHPQKMAFLEYENIFWNLDIVNHINYLQTL